MSDIVVGEIKTINFPCEAWKIDGETMMDFRILPIPGSWTLAPELLLRKGIKALVSCPNCKQAALIRHDMGTVVNGVNEISAFRCVGCGLTCNLRLQHWDKRKLFCIAYEALDADTGVAVPNNKGEYVRKEYTHALSRQEAFSTFVEVRKTMGRFRVVDVGEVIGFFGSEADKDQTNLVV